MILIKLFCKKRLCIKKYDIKFQFQLLFQLVVDRSVVEDTAGAY